MEKFIGRSAEIGMLQRCYESSKSEFVIVYGRRRIGKTFLVRHFFEGKFSFCYTGGHNLTGKEQLASFAGALQRYGKSPYLPKLSDWFEAFSALQQYLESLPLKQRKVVFLDEMPWIDHFRSNFVKAFENFWNGWAALRDDIFFIACGSATSWMVDKLVQNKGGLHNRITASIYLSPFCLRETEEYLLSHGCSWDRQQILQCYMALGGVPYYLSLLDGRRSLSQNLDVLFFAKNAALRNEFSELYTASFDNATHYTEVVSQLFQHKSGMTSQQLLESTELDPRTLRKILENLERCDFVCAFTQFEQKKKGILYRLVDFYTIFYYQFVESDSSKDPQRWSHSLNTPALNAWQGIAFERVCLSQLESIKKALGISGILTSASSWRFSTAQIDLVIERADRVINLCELKFSNEVYGIDAAYAKHIRDRIALFRQETKTRKTLVSTFVTTYGVLPGRNNDVVQAELTMDGLFL